MSEAFNNLLEILSDDSLALPIERLRDLSDLETGKMEQFSKNWDSISIERRRSLINEFGTLADKYIELNFEIINRYALSDPDGFIRSTAIQNLWESEDVSLIPIFIEILDGDPSFDVRSAAAKGLGSFVLISEIGNIDPALKERLEDALLCSIQVEQDRDIFLACLESLGYSSRNEVIQFIQQAYDSGEERLMKSALIAMGRSFNKIWQEQVIKALSNPSPELRLEAARAAGELELREALQDLIDLAEDVIQDVKHAAIWSISQVGSSRAGDVLSELIESSDDEETQLIQDALDNFAFVDGSRDFLLINYDDIEEELS